LDHFDFSAGNEDSAPMAGTRRRGRHAEGAYSSAREGSQGQTLHREIRPKM